MCVSVSVCVRIHVGENLRARLSLLSIVTYLVHMMGDSLASSDHTCAGNESDR